jgi:ABC-2 type transport system ATP-binding protein
MNIAIRATDLHKAYGNHQAVKGISFEIPTGCVYGFLGPNGAGKTSTLRMLMDIIRPDQGRIEILGTSRIGSVRNRIGYLPEEKGLYKAMTAESFMTYLGSLKGLSTPEARSKARAALDRFGMGKYARSRLGALSKGQGQKIQFLASLLHDPEIVIFDEPFSGLDPVNQQSLEKMIIELAQGSRTVIFSTHIMQHAERLCDRFLLISSGRKVFDGDLQSAREYLPRKAVLASTENPSSLKSVEGVKGVVPEMAAHDKSHPGAAADNRWEILMDRNVTPHQILEFCYRNGIGITHFEYSEPSLHDIFVHLVHHSGELQAAQSAME